MLEPYAERPILPDGPRTKIAELSPGVKNIYCTFIIVDKGFIKQTKSGSQVCHFKVADESGSISLCLWDDAAQYFRPGDVCTLRCGSTSVHNGKMSLITGRNSQILKTGRITKAASLHPDMSAYNPEFEAKFASTRNAPSVDNQDEGADTSVPRR